MRSTAKLAAVVVALSVTAAATVTGTFAAVEDWPYIYGPRRDHTSEQKGLLRTWPAEGPKVLWTMPVGPGFGGPSVKNGQVYLLDRDEAVGDTLRVLDLASGKELWTFAYGAPGQFMFAGSRTTPTLDGDFVYTSGPMGDLHAISIKTRKPVWQKNIWKDFGGGGELPRWSVVQNPLIYGDVVIAAPQTPQAGVVAYDKLTGALKWKSAPLSGLPGYVSPQIIKIGGEDHLIMITASVGRGRTARDGVTAGLDPKTGKVLWQYSGWQCAIPVPQPVDAGQGRILVTGGYGAGSAMFQVTKKGSSYDVKELYKNADFGAHTQPPVFFKDHFYSHFTVNERSDGLAAMSVDGQVKWQTNQKPAFVRGGTILAEGLLIVSDGNTKLYLVEPDPTAFKPISSVEILEPGDNWAPLALTDGKLLVRGQKQLKCLQVAQ